MSIIDSALQGAFVGALAAGIGYGIRQWMGRNGGRPTNTPKAGAASPAAGEDGTILPVHLPDADKPAGWAPEAASADEPARKGGDAANEEAVGWLVLRSGALKGRRYDLTPGEIRIGRSETCRIRIDDDEEISREHAMIRVNLQECKLCDLGSRNGTFLNGARVEAPRRLQEGDMLRIGGTEMTFIRA